MRKTLLISLVVFAVASTVSASVTTIGPDNYQFDLAQFNGASVTYRSDGGVSFDGKKWDQAAGVNGYTLGELAAGQYGSDPGDQVSLNDRSAPDWLQLNYASPMTVTESLHTFVVYEISSYKYVDLEGISFNIKFNNGSLIYAGSAVASNFNIGMGSDGMAEDINQLVFDLFDFGFNIGDTISTVYIENVNSGSNTSDPDFIFAGVAMTPVTVPVPGALLLGGLGIGIVRFFRKK